MATSKEILEFQILLQAADAVDQILSLGKSSEKLKTLMDKATMAVRSYASTNNMTFTEAASLMESVTGSTKEMTAALIANNKAMLEAAAIQARMRTTGSKVGGLFTEEDFDSDIRSRARAEQERASQSRTQQANKEADARYRRAKATMDEAAAEDRYADSVRRAAAAEKARYAAGGSRFAGQYSPYDTGKGVMGNKDYGASLDAIPPKQAKVADGNKKMGESARSAAQGFNVLRSAMGFLLAAGLSAALQAITQTIRTALDSVSQLELALYNLAVAEKTLSRAGIDITPKDFEAITTAVEDLNLSISKTDIAKGVADLATGLQDLGLSNEQLKSLSEAAAIIAMSEGLTMENVADQFSQGIAKGGKGLADLDIQVNDAVIKQKALEAQLVASEEAWNNLSAAQMQSIETQALLLIITDSANTKLEEMGMLEGTLFKAQKDFASEWEDFLVVLGQFAAPTLIKFLQEATASLESLNTWAESNVDTLDRLSKLFRDAAMGAEIFKEAAGGTDIGRDFALGGVFSNVFTRQGKKVGGLWEDEPTGMRPSGTTEQDAALEESRSKLEEALKDLNEEIIESQMKLEQDMEDAAIDLGRKLVDIDTEYARKRADVQEDLRNKIADINRDFSRTVSDINTDYNEKVSEIQADARQDEAEASAKAQNDALQKEAEFQNEMLKLKEDYLMSLEDALHERDARQVLKLMKEYNLNKEQATRDHELDMQQEAQKAAADKAQRQQEVARKIAEAQEDRNRAIAEAEIDRRRKIEDAKRDFEEKMAQLKIEQERERADAREHNRRVNEDLIKAREDRLRIIEANLKREFNLTEAGLKRILALYQQYGTITAAQMSGAMFTGSQQAYFQTPTTGTNKPPTSSFLGSSSYLNPALWGTSTSKPKPSSGGSSSKAPSYMANGGTIVADKPTSVTFGEAGLEMASFLPLSRAGADVGKMFGNMSNSNSGGNIAIEVMLSPDLEARIISSTLNETASVIAKVQNSKWR